MANELIYHGLVSRHAPLSIDLEIMRQTRFQGLEISADKMRAMLAAGFGEAELAATLKDVFIPGIGFLIDIERTGSGEAALFDEARDIFRLAGLAGSHGVQVLTGPVQVRAVEDFVLGRASDLYKGALGLRRQEQVAVTARNLARLADIAAETGLLLYLESLAWSPLNRLADQVELLERADRPNLRLVVDFWHCYASGDSPDTVARLPAELIYGVHVCDSLAFAGGIPNEVVLRDVPTGAGVLRLQDWVGAVKSTGYAGWWSCELFCRRQQQDNSFAVARGLHDLMSRLVGGT